MELCFNSAGVNRISRSRAEWRNKKIFFQLSLSFRRYSFERDNSEADGPVADFDQGDDGDSCKEAEGSSDGGNHVEDARPELQGDTGDDGGVVVKVENGDVAPESFSGKI